ncbi:hypothetical protein D3C78_1255490 [compost metagenome]
MLDIGFDAAIVHHALGDGADVADRLLRRVLPAERGDAVVAGNPDAAAGDRRGAAVTVALLHQQYIQAKVAGTQRGGHPAGSGTHHQYIALPIPGFLHARFSRQAARGHPAVFPGLFARRPAAGIVRWD